MLQIDIYNYCSNILVPSSTGFIQRCKNSKRQVAVATKFCTVAPDIIRFSVCNLIHVTELAPRIYKWLLDCWDVYAPLDLHIGWNSYVTPQKVSHRHHVCISIKRFLHREIQVVFSRVLGQCIGCTFGAAEFGSRGP